MDFVMNVLANNVVVQGALAIAGLWIGKKVINWLYAKFPWLSKVAKKQKLIESWERVIDRVKEDKVEAKAKGKELKYNDIQSRVVNYSSMEKVNPIDVKLHRRRLKRHSLGLDLGLQGKEPKIGLNYRLDLP